MTSSPSCITSNLISVISIFELRGSTNPLIDIEKQFHGIDIILFQLFNEILPFPGAAGNPFSSISLPELSYIYILIPPTAFVVIFRLYVHSYSFPINCIPHNLIGALLPLSTKFAESTVHLVHRLMSAESVLSVAILQLL